MTKPLDPDSKALRGATRALDGSSSLKMLRANMEYLWDYYIAHPPSSATGGSPTKGHGSG